MSIGATIIAYNEINALIGCIDSIKNYMDEIIIGIDNRTDDQTIAWIEDKKYTYFNFCLENNFSNAYNKATNLLTTDWNFSIDADERILEKHIKNLPSLIQQSNISNIDCFCFKRTNWVDLGMSSKDRICPSDYVYRLFKNNKKIRQYGRINPEIVNAKNIKFSKELEFQHFYLYFKNRSMQCERRDFYNNLKNLEIIEGSDIIKQNLKIKNQQKLILE